MLLIRKAQMDVFEQQVRAQFEDRMVGFLREHFPPRCDALGEPALRALIHDGLVRAARHGFEVYGEVSQYIVMMLVYGAAFDEDPALPWAATILRGSYQSSDTRMLCLYSEAQKQMVRGREEVAS